MAAYRMKQIIRRMTGMLAGTGGTFPAANSTTIKLTHYLVLTCAILGQMIQHVPDAALHASE
jgi:hypothetical protein